MTRQHSIASNVVVTQIKQLSHQIKLLNGSNVEVNGYFLLWINRLIKMKVHTTFHSDAP